MNNENIEELTHHGILGMKWGVRRYQNADGSLTEAGKKRVAKMKDEYTQLTGKQLRRKPTPKGTTDNKTKDSSQNEKNSGQGRLTNKSVKKLSDEEVNNRKNRLENEKKILQYQNDLDSAGKQFGRKMLNDALIAGTVSAGKQLTDSLLQKIGNKLIDKMFNNATDAQKANVKTATKDATMDFKKEMESFTKDFKSFIDDERKKNNAARARMEEAAAEARKSNQSSKAERAVFVKDKDNPFKKSNTNDYYEPEFWDKYDDSYAMPERVLIGEDYVNRLLLK